jgi:hypothetical protein
MWTTQLHDLHILQLSKHFPRKNTWSQDKKKFSVITSVAFLE